MIPRFSFLSKLPYDQHILSNNVMSITGNMADSPAKDIVQASLLGDGLNAMTTARVGQNVMSLMGQNTNQITNAVNGTTSAIVDGANKVALANMFGSLLTSGTIAVATKLVLKKIDSVNQNLERVGIGIDRLGSQFTEGFSLLTSKIDIQNNKLDDIKDQLGKIHETLKSPTITKAVEWRDIGLNRLGNGLFPEAIEAFTNAISLDQTDLISNLMLGKIYLDAVDEENNLHDPEKALNSFNKAARYAKAIFNNASKSKELLIEALYLESTTYLALASLNENTLNNSEQATIYLKSALQTIEKTLSFEPNHTQARFLKIRLSILLELEEDALEGMKSLIGLDINFMIIALHDKDFTMSECGKNVLRRMAPFLRLMLKEPIMELFNNIDVCRSWKIALPEEMTKWLELMRFTDFRTAKATLNGMRTEQMVDDDKTLLSIIKLSNHTLRELSNQKISSLQSQVHKQKNTIINKLNILKDEFIDYKWLKDISVILGSDKILTLERIVERIVYLREENRNWDAYKQTEEILKTLDLEIKTLKNKSESVTTIYKKSIEFKDNAGEFKDNAGFAWTTIVLSHILLITLFGFLQSEVSTNIIWHILFLIALISLFITPSYFTRKKVMIRKLNRRLKGLNLSAALENEMLSSFDNLLKQK